MPATIEEVRVSAYRIPTDKPESDGTIAWQSTTMVLVEVLSERRAGLGFTYAARSAGNLIDQKLRQVVEGRSPDDVAAIYADLGAACRNIGKAGIAMMAISAIDMALWDLRARLIDQSLIALLGSARPSVAAYGSGGFTSYSEGDLCAQLTGWEAQGLRSVKMKVGRDPEHDLGRVKAVRRALGSGTALFVDANGAYRRKQALWFADAFAPEGVTWFEEPVSSDDAEGLRLLRDRAPAGMQIAAGEYAQNPYDFRRLLDAGAVDVLQADATRCGGVSGFLRAAALCDAFGLPLSAHTAPSLHTTLACAAPRAENVEYFHDHVRIENMLFDGVPQPRDGRLAPDGTRPGWGLEFRRADAAKFAV